MFQLTMRFIGIHYQQDVLVSPVVFKCSDSLLQEDTDIGGIVTMQCCDIEDKKLLSVSNIKHKKSIDQKNSYSGNKLQKFHLVRFN